MGGPLRPPLGKSKHVLSPSKKKSCPAMSVFIYVFYLAMFPITLICTYTRPLKGANAHWLAARYVYCTWGVFMCTTTSCCKTSARHMYIRWFRINSFESDCCLISSLVSLSLSSSLTWSVSLPSSSLLSSSLSSSSLSQIFVV